MTKCSRIRSDRLLLIILTVSVAGRIAMSLALGDTVQRLPGTADQLSYHALAQRVVNGEGFTFETAWWPATAAGAETAHWSYLHTYFLAGIYAARGMAAIDELEIESEKAGARGLLRASMEVTWHAPSTATEAAVEEPE